MRSYSSTNKVQDVLDYAHRPLCLFVRSCTPFDNKTLVQPLQPVKRYAHAHLAHLVAALIAVFVNALLNYTSTDFFFQQNKNVKLVFKIADR